MGTRAIDRMNTQRNLKKPTRIDFTSNDGGALVIKFDAGGIVGKDIPREPIQLRGFEIIVALAWCEANGYTMKFWPGGARVWKGEALPVRSGNMVKRKREDAERLARAGYFKKNFPEIEFNVFTANFAFMM